MSALVVERPVQVSTRERAWPARLGVSALLAGTAALYLVGLTRSGWGNTFYAAAAQAGSVSWKAWFFGASDAPASIMIDKPPAVVWLMGLSARLFGVNSFAILVPQAVLGVTGVGLLYLTVRRQHGDAAGLLAGAVLALTPVATLIFRFDNPDALLVTLLIAAVYPVIRAVDAERAGRRGTWWLVLAGVLLGFAFLAKSLQALLVLPGLAVGYLTGSPAPWRRRLVRLLAAGGAMVVAGGWWMAVVELWPAADRPYVGGSQHNSVLELAFGYNGLGRLTGDETGSLGGGANGGSIGQLFSGEMAGQASWLLPAALVMIAVLVACRRGDSVAIWGGWLLVTGAVFSLAEGVIHAYYTVALAPAIAALVGIGGVELVRRRSGWPARACLAVVVTGSGVWAWWLLADSPGWPRNVLLGGSVVAGLGWLAPRARTVTPGRSFALTGLVVASVLAGLAAPAAYSVQTAATAHSGALPSAGPGGHGPGGHRPGGPGPGSADRRPGGAGAVPGGPTPDPGGPPPGSGGQRGPGGPGGMALLQGVTPSAELTAVLRDGAAGYTWVAATIGSEPAAGYQLAAGAPVMPVGGFNGTDPAPTPQAFQALVAAKAIHWFVDSDVSAGPDTGGSDTAHRIAAWVRATHEPLVIGGTTLYDLTTPSR
jgi:4-amino-4-deoxy-L-arabinose transferase-like glycosyltransferase